MDIGATVPALSTLIYAVLLLKSLKASHTLIDGSLRLTGTALDAVKFLSWRLIQQSEIEGYTGTGMDLHASVQDGATLYTRVLYLTMLILSIGKLLIIPPLIARNST